MKKMNLYIIWDVLFDYTSGMVVIAAPSLERCRELFLLEFIFRSNMVEYDDSIKNNSYSVYQVVGVEEGVKEYVYGGG